MKKWIDKNMNYIPPVFRNPYVVVLILFSVWMMFFDNNCIITQYKRHSELSSLNEKKNFYLAEIATTTEQLRELTTNPETQEKFAREHYWMKRDNEDVFVIVGPSKKED